MIRALTRLIGGVSVISLSLAACQVERGERRQALEDDEQLTCRHARIAAERAPSAIRAIAWIGATSAEQDRFAELLADRAAEVCLGDPGDANAEIAGLLGEIDERFSTDIPMLADVDGVVAMMVADEMVELERRCFGEGGITEEDLAAMSDAEFEAHLDGIAFGNCDAQESDGAGLASIPASAAQAYQQCVRDGLRDGIDRLRTDCNVNGTDGGDGETGGGEEPGQDEPGGEGGEEPGNEPSGEDPGPAADPSEDESGLANVVIGILEMGLGAVGVLTGTAIIIWSFYEVGGTGLAEVTHADLLIQMSVQLLQDGWRRIFDLCPAVLTAAGAMTYKTEARGGGTRDFSIAEVFTSCKCEHLQTHIEDPTGELAGECAEAAKRRDCLRQQETNPGFIDLDCLRLLLDDNEETLAERIADCTVVSCGNLTIGEDCNCWDLGTAPSAPEGGGGFPGMCDQVICPEGTLPIPRGGSCICEPAGGA